MFFHGRFLATLIWFLLLMLHEFDASGSWISGKPSSGSLDFAKSSLPENRIFENPSLRRLFRKSKLPEAWIFQNPSLRRIGFSKIQAPGSLDFRRNKLPEARIFEHPGTRGLDFSTIRPSGSMFFPSMYVNCTLIVR